ncbi:MAG: methyltransferase domain-containing protein [Candidatus Peribacteraceae bacterium]|nr:methyltransferase domain-containing protein [Candidatus Peribacteraceae bacterium]
MKTWTLSDVAAHWDSVKDYDGANSTIDSYMRRFKDSAPLFSIPDKANVLEYDTRSGNGTAFFAKKYPSTEINWNCLASCQSFVTQAKTRHEKNNVKSEINQLMKLPMPFEDNFFDIILCFETLEHMPNPKELILELSRMLKSQGTLVLTTPNVLWEPAHWISATFHLDHGEGPHRMVRRKIILDGFKSANLNILNEKSTVLVPVGPNWLIKFGGWLEKLFPERLMQILALRRTFICQKI